MTAVMEVRPWRVASGLRMPAWSGGPDVGYIVGAKRCFDTGEREGGATVYVHSAVWEERRRAARGPAATAPPEHAVDRDEATRGPNESAELIDSTNLVSEWGHADRDRVIQGGVLMSACGAAVVWTTGGRLFVDHTPELL